MAQVYITSNKPSEKKKCKKKYADCDKYCCSLQPFKEYYVLCIDLKRKKEKKEYYVSSLQKVYSFLQQKQYLSFCNGFFFLFLYICMINK